MSAFRRSIPFIAGSALLAATALTTAGCSATAEAAPVAAASATAISPSPSPVAGSASPSAAPSAAPSTSSAAPSPSAQPVVKPSPTHTDSSTSSSSLSALNAALKAKGVPCDATAVACVSLSKQEAWLLRDGKVVYGPVPVATGRASLPTPAGNFHVYYKVEDGWSRTYNAPMPYSVYFYEGDAFHQDSVYVRSHGCVHLTWTAAKYFFNFLHIGDKVEIR